MLRRMIVAAAFTLVALPALADPPDDIVDLLGARAPGAESQMQARGYVDAQGNNIWWKQATGICVKVSVSQGRYQTIDVVQPLDCGIEDFEQTEEAAPREPSQAAMDACMNAADALDEDEAGASRPGSVNRAGENWIITMHTQGTTAKCTVTQSGDVIDIE